MVVGVVVGADVDVGADGSGVGAVVVDDGAEVDAAAVAAESGALVSPPPHDAAATSATAMPNRANAPMTGSFWDVRSVQRPTLGCSTPSNAPPLASGRTGPFDPT